MRQIAIKSRKAGVLAGIFVFALCFFVPPTAHSYTYQDVQNYLAANPAPQNCYNWTEEYTANGQTGVKVWKRCNGAENAAHEHVEHIGGHLANIVHYVSGWAFTVMTCDGNGGHRIPQVGDTIYNGFTQVKITTVYCDARTTINYINALGLPEALSSPCLVYDRNLYDCTRLDTLLKTFFPIENCTDADHDGFYAYNAQTCPQGNDCDDSNSSINPNTVWYKDADGDGYTDGTTTAPQCQRPAGYKLATELQSTALTDCDDNDPSRNPQHPCCDLKLASFTGSNTLLNPSSGGTIALSGSIADSSGKPITWTVAIAGRTYEGTGTSVSVLWDGKDSNDKVVEPGEYTATLSARTDDGSCTDAKPLQFKVLPPEPNSCGRYVQFGSSADVASGNLSHSQELFATKGTSLATNITLYYNSLDGHNGALGIGWSHNYDISIKENSDGSILLKEGNWKRKLYEPNNGGYTSQPGDYSTLTKNPDGTFTITHKDGTRYNFNQDGNISAISDRNSNVLAFTHTNGDLTTIIDPAGRTTTLTYNADHRISTINDPNGNMHTFTYNGNDLTGVSTQNWSYAYYENSFMQSKTDPNGNTTTYTYDSYHRVASSTDPEGKVKTITYPTPDDTSQTKITIFTEKDGGVWTYTYDTQNGTLTSKTDPQNGTTSYTYDGNRNQTSKTEPDGSVTSYTYDINGNMTSQTDALSQTTSYTYNSYGQVTSITTSDNTTTSYEYDAKGNLTQIKDAAGQITTYSYDSRGNVVQITNAQGQITKFTYDQNNNLSSVTDPAGATTGFTYDTAGNMTSQTDASGNTTRFEYNSLGRLIKVIDPSGNATNSTYDNNGNKTSETDANGNVTYYEYNYKGQLIKVKDALGNVTTYTYGGTGCSSCGGGTDKLTALTDANGNATKYEYDRLGRLIKETDPLGNAISYVYDSKGNLTSKTDANGATVSYSYDSLGRLLKKSYPDNTTESFTYDTKGNIVTATNANISYTFGYNTAGKATSVTDSSGRTVSYQYDSLGNKTKLTYPEGSVVTYSYDKSNRLTSIVNGGGRTYSYQYDSLSRRSKLSLPNGTTANYSYDTSGRLTSLIHKTSSGAIIDSFAYTHDKVGNRLSKSAPDVKQTYSYDSIYRLLQAMPTKLKGKDIEQEHKAETYTYDPVGNRLTGPKSRLEYIYNPGNQLTEGLKQTKDEDETKRQYEYDKNGNLIKKLELDDDGEIKRTTLYSYDFENRLTKVEIQKDNRAKIVTFTYDPFGRRLSKTVHREDIEDDDDEDKDDEERECPRTTYYLYDNEDIVLEYNQKGKVTAKYVHGPGIDEPLAVEKKGKNYFYHADGLGSITALTDIKGKVVQRYDYDSFGNLKDQKNKVKQPYTFTGREWDRETGLYHNRVRNWDPKTGRWLQFDPILHPANGPPAKKGCGSSSSEPSFNTLLSRPLELNPYIYTLDSPTNYTDPYGKAIVSPYPLLPPSPENCAHYTRNCECGDQVACVAKTICLTTPNNIWFNCVRSCLKDKYLSRTNNATWLAIDHPVCYGSCPGGLLGP